ERMMSRTLAYVLKHKNFKLLASGRTDAKVSANDAYVELFLDDEPLDIDLFFPLLNENLPQDIRALKIDEVDQDFNVIEAPQWKEYNYLFSHGQKNHPFAAPFMLGTTKKLNIELMQEAAALFNGTHDFRNYTYKPKPETQTVVTILISEVVINTFLTANFFPTESFLFRVKGKGFKRHQIRLMMGSLLDVGEGKVNIDFIKKTLQNDEVIKLERIAPASGLLLKEVQLG
ncbi:MAG: tRNA pseudouridine(38-40) synthase TruA, partial [Flavobacteriaceae bacterium]|nr:tRNA pseudouridine(38-40) synthase TruA [Flavobacteriaceae bacterium]